MKIKEKCIKNNNNKNGKISKKAKMSKTQTNVKVKNNKKL